MAFVIVGILLVILKLAELGPFAKLSWWWVALPFVLVIIWWEVIVPMFALDKKKEHEEFERERKKRMDKNRSSRGSL